MIESDKIHLVIKVRFVAGALLFVFFGAVHWAGYLEFSFWAFSAAPLAAMFINQPYPFVRKFFKDAETLLFVNQTIDVLIITYGIHFVGGRDAFVMVLVYPLVFIYSALVLSPFRAYLMANLSFIAYAALVWAESSGWIDPIVLIGEVPPRIRIGFTLLVWPLFNLIAFFATYLSAMLRKREAELQEAKAHLEERVKARTAELADLNRKLQSTNLELQNFASVASHDMKEPLAKVMLFAEMLAAEPAEPSKVSEYTGRIVNAVERMRRLIEDLLRYATVSGEELRAESVSVETALREVVSDLETQIRETNAEIRFGTLGTVHVPRAHMRQLLQNLVGNALKYHSQKEPPLVTIETRRATEGFIELRVADNGIGFDPKHAEYIFEPFRRLHGKSEYAGTGLGLAICRKIALRYGGSIRAESVPGQGSTFIATLPGIAKR